MRRFGQAAVSGILLQNLTEKTGFPTVFGREYFEDSIHLRSEVLVQAPMEERRAFARDWLKRCTSASCSASTMTRTSGSVPE
jgi:hypothetical protein